MAAPSLIIFDCDGVLVDSEIIAAEVESASSPKPVIRSPRMKWLNVSPV